MSEPQRRICLITGGSAGIGRETARGMAELGFDVLLVGRNPRKTERAAAYVLEHAAPEVQVQSFHCDFSSQARVRELAAEVLAARERLHVLINNAGLWHPARRVGPDGIEDTLAVNHLAPYLLTRLLLDRLKQSAPARVVNVSSRLHEAQARFDFEDMQFARAYPDIGLYAYAQTKLANVMFSNELARRLAGSGVTSNAVHPGDAISDIIRERWWLGPMRWIARSQFESPSQAAQSSIRLASAPELEQVSGQYFRQLQLAAPSPAAQDADACARLWEISAQLVSEPDAT